VKKNATDRLAMVVQTWNTMQSFSW